MASKSHLERAGPEAQQLVIYLGWLMHRTWGGILAGSLFVLPPLLILIRRRWASGNESCRSRRQAFSIPGAEPGRRSRPPVLIACTPRSGG